MIDLILKWIPYVEIIFDHLDMTLYFWKVTSKLRCDLLFLESPIRIVRNEILFKEIHPIAIDFQQKLDQVLLQAPSQALQEALPIRLEINQINKD